MATEKLKVSDLANLKEKDLQKWIDLANEVKEVRDEIDQEIDGNLISKDKVIEHSRAMHEVLLNERPADRVKILKLLLEEARLHLKLEEGENPDENELVEDYENAPYPYKREMNKKRYEKELYRLQVELIKLQDWVKEKGKKVVILFEGRDAAGKGGTIQRFMEHLNPRGASIVALPKPTAPEKGQWYFQRYVAHLPSPGEIRLFDRSWYNRAGVERVMGFCTDEQYIEFLRQCPQFEESIINSDTILIKLWFAVTQKEQQRRFKARQIDPLRRWKLSPIDIASLSKWDDYTKASEVMFFSTNTLRSPWIVVKSDDKKRARLNAIRYVLSVIPYEGKDLEAIGRIDPLILSRANVTQNVAHIIKKKIEQKDD